MALKMASPTKHPRTGVYRVRLAIPKHLRTTTFRLYGRRAELIEGLQTKDPRAAKALADAAASRLRQQLAAAELAFRGEERRLSDQEVQALAGVFYRREVEHHGSDPGPAGGWQAALDQLGDQIDPDPEGPREVSLGKHDLTPARSLLKEHGLPADQDTVTRLGHAIYAARRDVAHAMLARAEGDWRPDQAAARFPVMLPCPAPSAPATAACTIDDLLAGFALDKGWGALDATPIPRPLYDRKRTLERLAAFVGHRDASRITKADALAWKEEMQGRNLHASTIRNDLSECSAVWTWGIRMSRLPADLNPFSGISPPKAKKKGKATRAFTKEEAAMILQAARGATGWKRWLPWVLCLSGARLAEVVQSQKEDVATVDGVMVLRLHDNGPGRSLKNEESRRDVPIHPALVAEGFLDYVRGLKTGSALFPDIPVDKLFGTRSANAAKRSAYWIKGLGVTDRLISPSHSFRHWWKGAARGALISADVHDAITGHSTKRNEGSGYGDGMKTFVAVLAEAMAKVPCPVTKLAKLSCASE